MMIDPNKIKKILKTLNESEGPGKGFWQEAAGYHVVIAAEISGDSVSPVPESAAALKMFINTETGEVRTYLAKILDPDFKSLRTGQVSSKSNE